MTPLDPALYEGREQTYVKHFVLEKYLEKLAFKVGSFGATLNYIDGFAGPWQSHDEKLADTSPHIAVRVLRNCRNAIKGRGQPLRVRAMFVESDEESHRRLVTSLDDVHDVEKEVLHAEFEGVIDRAVAFAKVGDRAFAFSFIDPCSWVGYGLHAITPLLRLPSSEVLINFMTSQISRWIDNPNPNSKKTFVDLFGTDELRASWAGLHGWNREEAIVDAYRPRIQAAGAFRFVAHAIVLHPTKDRTFYHLIYASRHPEGLRTFRNVERSFLSVQGEARAAAKYRGRLKRSGQSEFAFSVEGGSSDTLDELRQRYQARARASILEVRDISSIVDYDDLVLRGIQHPMTAEQDVSTWLLEQEAAGSLCIQGRAERERTPKFGRKHRIRWT